MNDGCLPGCVGTWPRRPGDPQEPFHVRACPNNKRSNPEPAAPIVAAFADQEALRGHLDDLNEAGYTPVVVGLDSSPQPFLITLVGPYAEGEHVFFDSPWQGDIDWREGHKHCDDCLGHVHGIEHLRYPVTVMVAPR